MADLPSGTVTFLFTDIADSTRLWDASPDAMRAALTRHDELMRGAIETRGGKVVKTTGDGFFAVFVHAGDGLDAALAVQEALAGEPWDGIEALRVRMSLHTCEAEAHDGDYHGSSVNRAARLMSIGHGGQVLASSVTAELARDAGFVLSDLGEHRLAGLTRSEHVWQVCPEGRIEGFPPLRSVDALPGNLPRQVTSFVGRDDEVDALTEMLRARSLVTLTGVGGVGKTRLALEAAGVVISEFEHGAWLCELAPVTDRDAVWDTVAATFRILPAAGRTSRESVLDYLSTKRLLLVLDNCEHQLDAAAEVVSAIEQRCPKVTVLATSREGLAVAGEQMVAVPALRVPNAHADDAPGTLSASVVLFCDRASSVKRDFEPTAPVLETVGVLCRRLDGIPLAIELAAARAASLAPEDLVARLDQRFKLLGAWESRVARASPDAAEHHRLVLRPPRRRRASRPAGARGVRWWCRPRRRRDGAQ